MLALAAKEDFRFADVDHLGKVITDTTYIQKHIDSVLKLDLVDVEAIKAANFKVAIDCVNSVGGIAIPALLEALGVKQVLKLNCEPTGHFAHNPEPLPEHLTDISNLIRTERQMLVCSRSGCGSSGHCLRERRNVR